MTAGLVTSSVEETVRPSATGKPVPCALRRFPYPYHAMLAICSDLDETPDAAVYAQIMRYLNTTDDLGWGRGVGLEVGNTIYFDMPPGQFAYWNTDDAGRAMAQDLIRSGHIDCLHSFGDLATTRNHAERALSELERHGLRIEVWVDHAVAPSNFGADIMRGSGDVPGSPAYHADLTSRHGVQYVWRGRVTSVIGQDQRPSLGGVGDPRHPFASARTLMKESMKARRARSGDVKYAMHGGNELARPGTLRDGTSVWEFIRCNPHWGGVSRGDTSSGMAEVLTARFLDRLVERAGICILYTHLGKIQDREAPFAQPTRRAFERLAEHARRQQILVTTTRRLLGYRQAREHVHAEAVRLANGLRIDLTQTNGRGPRLAPADWQGLTVYLDASTAQAGELRSEKALLCRVNGNDVPQARLHPPDETGRVSVSIPWQRLEFPRR
ncbi:MAG: hypothetical protein IT449_15090 [Phycisphaerales bacterium]|nr:hypothetical protein [Phycisphaerales bacterium]